jgi:hypothetical protein
MNHARRACYAFVVAVLAVSRTDDACTTLTANTLPSCRG